MKFSATIQVQLQGMLLVGFIIVLSDMNHLITISSVIKWQDNAHLSYPS